MKQAWQLILQNPKTTVTGVLMFVLAGVVATGKITPNQALEVTAFLGGIGLTLSGDAKTPAQQTIVKTELMVAQEALEVAKASGNEKLIAFAQAGLDALQIPAPNSVPNSGTL